MKANKKKNKLSHEEKIALFWKAINTQRLYDLREGLVNTAIQAQTRNEEGLTSIMFAASYNKVKSLDCLLDWYARRRELRSKGWINLCDYNGRSALIMAAARGHVECVHSLLLKDANHLIQDKNGKTARDYAIEHNRKKVLDILDEWFLESDEELSTNQMGETSNNLTSTQLSKIKRRQLEMKEGKNTVSSVHKEKKVDSYNEKVLKFNECPTPVWPEIAKVIESIKMLRPIYEISIIKNKIDPTLKDTNIDPALWYLHDINKLELRLAKNVLTTIPGQNLIQISKLNSLILNNNSLESLPEEIGGLIHLKVLEVSNNQLQELPDSISQCQDLETINLSFNNIKSITQLKDISTIHSLNVNNNLISELDLDFDNLPRLREIFCSYNRITEIPSEIKYLSQLMTLVAENNFITDLPVEITELKKIKILKLVEGNKFKDQKIIKMLVNDQRKDLWKYLEKKQKSSKNNKHSCKTNNDIHGNINDISSQVSNLKIDDVNTSFISDDSFDITIDEI